MSYVAKKEKGIRWDEDTECIKDSSGKLVISVRLMKPLKIWAFDQPRDPQSLLETTAHAHAVHKSAKPLVSEASEDRWHRRLAHVSTRVVKKTAEMVDGVKINKDLLETEDDDKGELCQVCNLSHAPRQISRRPIGQTYLWQIWPNPLRSGPISIWLQSTLMDDAILCGRHPISLDIYA
jgi:hypothetical protein